MIDRCFELITAVVHRFEGTINQYTRRPRNRSSSNSNRNPGFSPSSARNPLVPGAMPSASTRR